MRPAPPPRSCWRSCSTAWTACPATSARTGRCGAPTAASCRSTARRSPSPGGWCRRISVVLEKAESEAEHRLTAAVLCFPSNWTLSQKLGMPLVRIHLPVEVYDETVAKRVQRLLDAVRPEAPLMRANLIPYAHATLHSPRPEFARHSPGPGEVRFVRVERQTLLRLPVTRAVVFSIHAYQVPLAAITGEERARLEAIRPHWFAPAPT